MSRTRAFRFAGLDGLEWRIAPAGVTPVVAVPPADVVQSGDYQGQFGDQTGVDSTAATETAAGDAAPSAIDPAGYFQAGSGDQTAIDTTADLEN